MSQKMLEASVRRVAVNAGTLRADGVAIIDLRGEINVSAEAALNVAYAEASRENSQAALLNFEGVDYINSTGIALTVQWLSQARKAGRRLLSYGLNDHYVEIFRITRLVEFMDVYPDEASALAALAAPA